MAKRDPTVALRHMHDHAHKAIELIEGKTREEVEGDEVLLLALARLLEILGEASGRVGEEIRVRHPAIPWKSIIGLRNVLIHGYDVVDMDILWRVLSEDLPHITPLIESALEEESAR